MIDIVSIVQRSLAQITLYSQWIFATSAMIYLLIRIISDLSKGNRIDFLGLAKPLIIIIVLINYTIFFNLLNETFEKGLTKITEDVAVNISPGYKQDEIDAKVNLELVQANKEEKESAWSFSIESILRQGVTWLIDLLKDIVRIVLEVFQKTSLGILYVIGPLVFALELMPGMGGSIRAWVMQIITISLWVPILNVMTAISLTVGKLLANTLVAPVHIVGQNTELANNFIFLILSGLIAIFSYIRVPSIAGSLFGSGQITGGSLGLNAMASAATFSKGLAGKAGGKLMEFLKNQAGGGKGGNKGGGMPKNELIR